MKSPESEEEAQKESLLKQALLCRNSILLITLRHGQGWFPVAMKVQGKRRVLEYEKAINSLKPRSWNVRSPLFVTKTVTSMPNTARLQQEEEEKEPLLRSLTAWRLQSTTYSKTTRVLWIWEQITTTR